MIPPGRIPWWQRAWVGWLAAGTGLAAGAVTVLTIPADQFFRDDPHAAATAMDGTTVTGSASRTQMAPTTAPQRWACPMMDFVGTKPGKCPICGMTLQLVTAGEVNHEQADRMGVQIDTIAAGPALVTVHAYGAVRYDDRQEHVVIPRISGRVVRRHPATLHPGLDVQVGDPLLDIYSTEVFTAESDLLAVQRLDNAKAVAALRQRFGRWNLLPVADALLAGGQPVDTVTITSPFAGRVIMAAEEDKDRANEPPKVGSAVDADKPILRLVEPHSYMVVVHVPEPKARLLRAGQSVSLASDDAGELPDVQASISWVAPELNPEIRAREVHLHLRDPRDRLLPGSLINARFKAVLGPDLQPADPDAPATWGSFPLIPATAVLSTGVRNVAWKLSGHSSDGRQQFTLAPLALGQRLEDADGMDRYVVRAGLVAGDQVAVQGAFLIDSQAQLAGTPSLLYPLGSAAPAATPDADHAQHHQHGP